MTNIDRLAEIFPECITETERDGKLTRAIDFDTLRQLLSDELTEGSEVYGFNFVGKKSAWRVAHSPTTKTLRPAPERSRNFDTTQNLYIEGDNLDALKILQESYFGKVKLIYIDPPYNTGNDFIYRDDFKQTQDEFDKVAGNLDDDGNRIRPTPNPQSNGHFHSDWCAMIYARLELAKHFLAEDGVIFISIDDHEQATLKLICDEIFGGKNFVAQIPWRKRTAKSDVPFGVSQDFEWIICYAKSDAFVASIEGGSRKYFETDDFPGKPWRIHDLTKQTTAAERPNSFFTIVNPKNGEEFPAQINRTWAITKETFWQYYSQDRIIFPGDYDFLNISRPVLRYWKADDIAKAGNKFGRIAVSTKLPDEIGMSQDGTREITEIFGGKVFSFPKPSKLIKFLLQIATDENSIVMDFFSGSGTTAQAVMELNASDGGHRKFIMIQIPEPTPETSEARRAGYETICDIGRERIRRAGDKLLETHPELDAGFRVLKVAESNFVPLPEKITQQTLAGLVDNIKPDRNELDLLFGALLEMGLPINLPVTSEQLDGFKILRCSEELLACFDKDIPPKFFQRLAIRRPQKIIFRDAAFKSSADKLNALEMLKAFVPDEGVKIL